MESINNIGHENSFQAALLASADRIEKKGNVGGDSAAKHVIEIIDGDDKTILFQDELGEPFVRLNVNDHNEIWSCKSKQFRRWISNAFWKKYNKPPAPDALRSALNIIEARACFECKKFRLFNRVAVFEDAIWYDLADKDWRAVKITASGWEIVADPPILFRRYRHQDAQCTPVSDGDMKAILKHVNITDQRHQLLFMVYIISCFIPGFPHPVPNIYGRPGSAKSAMSKLLKKLIDPSQIEVVSLPTDLAQLAQTVAHHWFLCFDNISYMSEATSDMLCKVVTGSGFSKRELYSDDEDIIYSIKHCIALNGVNLPATKGDLLDRSILFELQKVERREEKKLLQEFERDHPLILGAIFDAVAGAMKIYPSLDISNLPRMADFTLQGCAIAEALGYPRDEFLEAYRANISTQNAAVLAEHIESSLLVDFMDGQESGEWVGRYSELLDKLKKLALDQKINEKLLPKSPNALSRRLNVLKPNLEEAGISITSQSSGQRLVTIRKVTRNVAPTANIATAIPEFDQAVGDVDEYTTGSA